MAARSTSFRAGRWWPVGFEPVTEDDLAPLPKGFAAVDEADLAPATAATAAEPQEEHFFPRSFSEAAQQAKDVGLGIARGAKRANDFATNLIFHPVDTGKQIAAAPGASFRQTMRGVNSNIPFANQAVEAAGGPAASSPADAASAPAGLSEFSSIAAIPGVGKMVGGIASKGLEAGGNALSSAGARAVKEAAKPAGTSTVFKAAQRAGTGIGATVGYKTGGAVGAAAGGYIGKQAGETIGGLGDRLVAAMAKRYAAKLPVAAATEAAELEPIHVPDNPQLVPLPEAPIKLAPLVSKGPTLATEVPEGTFATSPPAIDDITGQPLTEVGKGGFLPGEAATKAGVKPVPTSAIEDEGQKVLAELADLKAKGITKAPPELQARAERVLAKIDGKPAPRSFRDDVVNTAKLVKMAKGGAKKAAIRKAAADMGLPDEIVSRVLEKPPLGHEAARGE